MAVKMRLTRIGKKHAPFYRIVITDSRNARDGKILENLGTYDALKSTLVQLHQERVEFWLGQGAVPTDSVKRIYAQHKKTAVAA
ncbi:MAG: 30S ribosomal protein S16 [candidate division TM6 bacterium GW2011_GWF2_43_17]|nr:MAG: 30S ribosomal protein S16 [candidate division TM6 bacterium GW2011_GWF2_43_17]HAU30164.1 30S ribosomal protein S16 [Candidatus Dependentiae bacterium]